MAIVKNPTSGHQKSGGYSLVELLFITVIIGILASLLMPALRAVRQASRSVYCLSNIRQIGLGLEAYSKDNDNSIPPLNTNPLKGKVYDTSKFSKTNTWAYAAWNYFDMGAWSTNNNISRTSKPNLFVCPITVQQQIYVPKATKANDDQDCYGIPNDPMKAIYPTISKIEQLPINRNIIQTPSETALIVECSTFYTSAANWKTVNGLIPHRAGSNILYYDGHVANLRSDSMTALPTTDKFWTGN